MPLSKNITPFDTSQVNAVLRAIVAEHPAGTRYVDPYGTTSGHASGAKCRYVDQADKGSCLVGRAAERLGIPMPTFDAAENYGVIFEGHYFAQFFTEDAVDRLRTVQRRQDNGETWRRAIR